MSQPSEGFWQVIYEDPNEEIVEFRDTTTAVRPAVGFSILTGRHLMEIRSSVVRRPPGGWPPTPDEALGMMRGFISLFGESKWLDQGGRWVGETMIAMASDPRLEGATVRHVLELAGDRCRSQRTLEGGSPTTEEWRRLSGAGDSPLSGAWHSGDLEERWVYLVTAGHYGVMRTSAVRPTSPANGDEFDDEELLSLWEGFGVNAGARLETAGSFDHWPMVGQVAGYEVRKHETFKILTVESDRFVAILPPYEDADEGWTRLE